MSFAVQMEENLEREKKVRADVEKAKRKVESDLKMTQETVEELERVKRDLEESVRKYVSSICVINCYDIINKYHQYVSSTVMISSVNIIDVFCYIMCKYHQRVYKCHDIICKYYQRTYNSIVDVAWRGRVYSCYIVKLPLLFFRKDNEINNLNGKLESEQNLVAQLQKKIKELQVTLIWMLAW